MSPAFMLVEYMEMVVMIVIMEKVVVLTKRVVTIRSVWTSLFSDPSDYSQIIHVERDDGLWWADEAVLVWHTILVFSLWPPLVTSSKKQDHFSNSVQDPVQVI